MEMLRTTATFLSLHKKKSFCWVHAACHTTFLYKSSLREWMYCTCLLQLFLKSKRKNKFSLCRLVTLSCPTTYFWLEYTYWLGGRRQNFRFFSCHMYSSEKMDRLGDNIYLRSLYDRVRTLCCFCLSKVIKRNRIDAYMHGEKTTCQWKIYTIIIFLFFLPGGSTYAWLEAASA